VCLSILTSLRLNQLAPTHHHVVHVGSPKKEVKVAGQHDNLGGEQHHDEVPPEHNRADEAGPEHNVRGDEVRVSQVLPRVAV
jgi:hypothetical protein